MEIKFWKYLMYLVRFIAYGLQFALLFYMVWSFLYVDELSKWEMRGLILLVIFFEVREFFSLRKMDKEAADISEDDIKISVEFSITDDESTEKYS